MNRPCAECGRIMRNAVNRVRCQSCITSQNHREGCFDGSQIKRADHWTVEDNALIQAMAGNPIGAQGIVDELARLGRSRSIHAVRVQAARLEVYIQPVDWSQHRICQLFGSWEHTIARVWFESGLMPAYRLPLGVGCRQGEWRVKEADLETFIRTKPWAFDATRMRPETHRLARLAMDIQRRDPWLTAIEARRYLGLSYGALWRWCQKGVVPYRRRSVNMQGGANGQGCIVIRAADLPWARDEIERLRRIARQELTANLQEGLRRKRAQLKVAA